MVLAHPTKEKHLDDGRTREFGIEEDAARYLRLTPDGKLSVGRQTYFKKYSRPTRRDSRNAGRNLSRDDR
jgi:hypothetical protein